jgi:hypothetical protein
VLGARLRPGNGLIGLSAGLALDDVAAPESLDYRTTDNSFNKVAVTDVKVRAAAPAPPACGPLAG